MEPPAAPVSSLIKLRRQLPAWPSAWAQRWVESWALPVALVLLAGACARESYLSLDPSSLWLDDEWVAVLAKHASLLDLLRLKPPSPIGYLVVLKGVAAIFGAGHRPLELVSLVARVIAVPLVGFAAYRLTRRWLIGVLGASVIALHVEFAEWSIRVKQFTTDVLIGALVLALAVECFRAPSTRRLLRLAVVGAVGLLFSLGSVFTAPLLVNAAAVDLAWRERTSWKRAAQIAAGFDAVLLLLALALFRGQASPQIREYWHGNFVPTTSWKAASDFLWNGPGWKFLANPFGAYASIGTVLVGLALIELVRRRDTRLFGLAAVGFYAEMLLAATLKLYPVGETRTDSFSWPFTLVLACAGAALLLRRRFWLEALLGAALVCLAVPKVSAQHVGYKYSGDKPIVERLNEVATDGTPLVIFPWANWAVGYYGRWDVDLVPEPDSTNRFYVVPRRPETLVLPENATHDAARAEADLRPFLEGKQSVLYFGNHLSWTRQEALLAKIRLLGFHEVGRERQGDSQIVSFAR